MSSFYVLPVGIRPMSSWSSHQRRNPKSSEPGTDFYCPIGTPVKAPEAGRVYAIGDSIAPATGRWVGIDFDDGRRFRVLHLQRRTVSPGDRVERSQIIGYSGASGYGKEDWSNDPNTGGAHVHVTLWPTQQMLFGYRLVDGKSIPYTIDFYVHAALGDLAGGGSTPFDPEEDDMNSEQDAALGTIFSRVNTVPAAGLLASQGDINIVLARMSALEETVLTALGRKQEPATVLVKGNEGDTVYAWDGGTGYRALDYAEFATLMASGAELRIVDQATIPVTAE